MRNRMKSITTKFISHFLNDQDSSLFIENNFWNKEKQDFIGLFDFGEYLKKDSQVNFIEYFQDKDGGKYDLIVAELPFGLKKSKNKDFNFSIFENWEMIYKLLNTLKDNGILLVGVEPSLGTSTISEHFLKSLQDKKFYLSALIEAPQNILAPLTALQPNIAIFTKKDNEGKIFISSLDETDNEEVIFSNLKENKKKNNLSEGDIVEIKGFKGFFNYRFNNPIHKTMES